MRTKLLIGLCILALLLLSGCKVNKDSYLRTSSDTPYDKECEKIGKIVLEKLSVHYPEGFICSSWLQEELYPSKSKCSCYRGRPIEVITYYRESGEVIRANSNVIYASSNFAPFKSALKEDIESCCNLAFNLDDSAYMSPIPKNDEMIVNASERQPENSIIIRTYFDKECFLRNVGKCRSNICNNFEECGRNLVKLLKNEN